MSELTPSSDQSPLSTLASRGVSRRAVVRTAAWSAPAITVVAAAPAVAASATPVITATWVTDSFRTTSAANLVSGTPTYSGGAQQGALAVAITINGADVTSLTVSLATAGNGVTYNNSAANRTTTWAASNADVASAGFAASPAVTTTTAFTSATYTHGAVSNGTTLLLKLVVNQIGTADFPLDFVVSAPGAVSKTVRATGSTTVSPYISGTTL